VERDQRERVAATLQGLHQPQRALLHTAKVGALDDV
jgi:hypothetical protein